MAFGRPRKYNRNEVADNMLSWAQKESSINLCGFCAEYLIPSSNILSWTKEKTQEGEDFLWTYTLVKDILGARRELRLSDGTLAPKAYDLNAHTYDNFMKDEKKDMMSFESSLKREEVSQATDNQESNHNKLIDHISDLKSALKIPRSMIDNDSKS